MHVLSGQDWSIGYRLTTSEQYFSYIQDENKLVNMVGLNIALRQQGKRLLTVTGKVWRDR